MPDNCNPCSTPTPTCTDCTQVVQQINYCDDGCADLIHSNCVIFDGANISLPGGVVISNSEQLTTIIQKLANNSLDVSLAATFNPVSRILSLTKNGALYASLTIPDQDAQYLQLDGTKLQIWTTPSGGSAVMVNQVDLALSIPETTFSAQSNSLVISPGGVKGHSPSIELVPSGDVGNKMILGSDGHPYVPTDAPGIKDVVMLPTPGISYTKTVQNGVITFQTVLDVQWFADNICPLCNADSCGTPSNLNAQSV